MSQCKFVKKHALILFEVHLDEMYVKECDSLKANFCGKIYEGGEHIEDISSDAAVYFCGNVGKFNEYLDNKDTAYDSTKLNIIDEMSYNHEEGANFIHIGEVPLRVYDVGLYIRDYFGSLHCNFDLLMAAHEFQVLTESDKSGSSYRKGIYLSKVESGLSMSEQNPDEVKFNLLRCSTNFDGATLGFADIDNRIIDKVNETSAMFFDNPAPCNHVLAQVYENCTQSKEGTTKEKKARIKRHSDKTKDMPSNGLIAFCTFYSRELPDISKASKEDLFDRVYKNTSVLTKLRFRLKDCVTERSRLKEDFSITLYPNSLFIIPLSTNRLYSHEIVPSTLPVDKIPTRLGYVIRCSKTEAIHKDDDTYVKEDGEFVKLERPSESDRAKLKALYFEENMTDRIIDYPKLNFSVNNGDYLKPSM